MRTKAIFSLGVTLLAALCAGCVSHESGKPALAGADVPGVRPCDHYYARPWTQVCPVDPVFSGYHATCWTPWPEYWTGCPPPAVGVEIPAVATGDGDTGEPSLASTPSVFDEIEPPASPLIGLMEPEVPSPPDADTLDPETDADTLGSEADADALDGEADADTLGPAADADALGPEADADTLGPAADADALGPAADADALGPEVITQQEASPFLEEALPQTDEMPLSSETQEGKGRPPGPPLGESDESRGGAQPEPDLASPPATTIDPGATGTGEQDAPDPQGSMPPAPLPKETLSLFARPADTKLPAVPDKKLGEGGRGDVGASGKDSPGWVFCSDDPVAEAVETSRQTGRVRSGFSWNFTALSDLLHAPAL